MICRVVDDDGPNFGKSISVSLEDMCQMGRLIGEDNLFRNALVFERTETVEESCWVLEEYEKIKSQPKIVVMNVDPYIEQMPEALVTTDNLFFGNILKQGDADIMFGDPRNPYGNVLYHVMFQMLLEDNIPFLEARICHNGEYCFYKILFHENGEEFLMATAEEMDDVGDGCSTVEKYLTDYLA